VICLARWLGPLANSKAVNLISSDKKQVVLRVFGVLISVAGLQRRPYSTDIPEKPRRMIVALALTGIMCLIPGQVLAQSNDCTGSLAAGELSLANNNAVMIRLGDRRLKIPWRFLNESPYTPDSLCKLGGDRFSAQFWFPGLMPTEKVFWYYTEQAVKGWSPELDPRKLGVINLVSVETYDENRLKRNSAGNRIKNTLRSYGGPNLRLVDEHGLNKIVSPERGMANHYWCGFRREAGRHSDQLSATVPI
jgi:hypothetical protein